MSRPLWYRAVPVLNRIPGVHAAHNHAWGVKVGPVELDVWHRMRSSRLSAEWHHFGSGRYIEVGVASPTAHRWWATKAVLNVPWLPGREGSWTWRKG